MTKNLFRVAMLGEPPHPAFLEAMAAAKGCELIRLRKDDDPDEIARQVAECDGYYVSAARDEVPAGLQVTDEFLSRMPRLLIASSYGAGYDTIDVDACTRHGVAACNQAGGNAEAVAQHALGFMLLLLKRIPEATLAIRQGTAGNRSLFMGRELFGRTVGIIGLGHVGTRLAHYLKAFDCEVLACDPYLDDATCAERGAVRTDLDDLLTRSDIVSINCPLSSETRHMISSDAIGRMRDGAILVTTARGGIHDEAAVLAGLESGKLAGAGLDVWEQEPPPVDHPLLAHPCVMTTSHTAGVTDESRTRVTRMAAETFAEAAAGNLPPRLLNPDVKAAFERRLAERLADSVS